MGSDEDSKHDKRLTTLPPAIRKSSREERKSPKFWYSNAIFFVGTHIAACVGIYRRPLWTLPPATLLLAFCVWQASCFGVTIGYHRLYSHRSFRASLPVRVVLAALGSMAFQGSIKWWCLRHRLHHRFTDDPVHDPYAATRGLFFSHMGWIFFKPNYEKMELVDRDDLENDPVARFQHSHYVPIALTMGFILPTFLGFLWHDPMGAYIWAGLVARLAIWHCTFFVNSLAHWDGLQPYSDEDTSRGNLILALLTCGEGNHNFHVRAFTLACHLIVLSNLQHTFPHDFRSGPSPLTWDPSKWIIMLLHRIKLVSGLRRAREDDVRNAKEWMRLHGGHAHGPHAQASSNAYESSDSKDGCTTCSSSEESESSGMESESWVGEIWNEESLKEYIRSRPGRCVVIIDGYAVEVTKYMGEHPGGATLLREYSVRPDATGGKKKVVEDANTAFNGGLNKHSRAAKRRMAQMRLARVIP